MNLTSTPEPETNKTAPEAVIKDNLPTESLVKKKAIQPRQTSKVAGSAAEERKKKSTVQNTGALANSMQT